MCFLFCITKLHTRYNLAHFWNHTQFFDNIINAKVCKHACYFFTLVFWLYGFEWNFEWLIINFSFLGRFVFCWFLETVQQNLIWQHKQNSSSKYRGPQFSTDASLRLGMLVDGGVSGSADKSTHFVWFCHNWKKDWMTNNWQLSPNRNQKAFLSIKIYNLLKYFWMGLFTKMAFSYGWVRVRIFWY